MTDTAQPMSSADSPDGAAGSGSSVDLPVTASTLVAGLWVTIITIAVANLCYQAYLDLAAEPDLPASSIIEAFVNVQRESAFPTWLSAALMVTGSGLALVLAKTEKCHGSPHRRAWQIISVAFLAMSIDEVASVHETLQAPLRELLDLGGWLYYAWILPASGLVLAVVALTARTVWSLPPSTRRSLLLAGALFVGGAIGLEAPGGVLADSGQRQAFSYAAVSTIEEALELAGLTVFVGALIRHLSRLRVRINLVPRAGD